MYTRRVQQKIIITAIAVIGWFGVFVFSAETASAQVAWNATEWTLYDTITIDATQVDAHLNDFPVYIDLSDLSASFWSTTPSASSTVGTDIRVVNASGTPFELPRELVAASSTAQTGELWFKANYISSTTDTTFRIYYNGTTTGDYATTSTYGAQNVWTNGFEAVYHLNDDPGPGGSGDIIDSTGNGNDGTADSTMTTSDLVAGKTGNAFDFDGADDTITLTDMDWDAGPMTLSAWFNVPESASTTDNDILTKRGSTDPGWIYFTLKGNASNGTTRIGNHDGSAYQQANSTQQNLADGNWNYVVGAWGTSNMTNYTNAVAGTSDTHDNNWPTDNDPWHIGSREDSSAYLTGQLDEVRLASSTRSAAWVSAEYVNQSTTTDFYTVNKVFTWNATDWTLYDTITIESDNIDDDLTDFPVYVDLADLSATFWATTPSASTTVGTDIRVTTNGGTELPRELVAASSTAQTGELWFKADSISSTTDTVFRIYYNGNTSGDYAATDTYGRNAVWDNGFEAVYHFEDDPGPGGAGDITDSTGNGNDGTALNMESLDRSTSGSESRVGSAYDFNGTNETISLTDMDWTSAPLTMSAWFKTTDTAARSLSKYDTNVALQLSHISLGRSRVQLYDGSYSESTNATQSWADDNWHYLVGAIDASNVINYTDGVATTSASHDNSWPNTDNVWYIGSQNNSSDFLGGDIDEVRLASSTRSAAWISAEYLNQSTTTDFYTVNAALGGGTPQNWSASFWTLYDTITIDATQVDAHLNDFPVYIDLSDLSASFWSTTPSASSTVGTDIRVVNASGTPFELPRELVAASSTAQTGELWFKANYISSTTDTTFRIYYNGTTTGDYATTSTYGAQNVWTNDYVGVWHFNEDPSLSATAVLDSTQNNNHGSSTGGMTTSDLVAGKSGYGLEFDGTDDFINFGSPAIFDLTQGNAVLWFSVDDMNTGRALIAKESASLSGHGSFELRGADAGADYRKTRLYTNPATTLLSSSLVSTSTWSLGGFNFNGTDSQEIIFDGSLDNSNSSGLDLSATAPDLLVGAYTYDGSTYEKFFDGVIDEVRVSSSTRSAAWISAEYLNQSTTTDFYTVDAIVSSGGSITITGTLYENNGVTAGPAGKTIVAAVGTSTVSLHSTTTDASGNFSIEGIAADLLSSTTPIVLFVDENSVTSTSSATTITYGIASTTGTTTLSNVNLYSDTVFIITAVGDEPIRLASSTDRFYDNDDDSDILFIATTSTTTINADLRIASNTTLYAPANLVVDGDFVNRGTFENELGELIMDGESHDITSAVFINNEFTTFSIEGVAFKSDGTRFFTTDRFNNVTQYDLSTAWDLGSLGAGTATSVNAYNGRPMAVQFTSTGTKMFVVDLTGRQVEEYSLSTAWDITTSSYVQATSTNALQPAGLAFSTDGLKMYVTAPVYDEIEEYTLSTAWDVSTASYDNDDYSVVGQTGNPNGVQFRDDGKLMFVIGSTEEDVFMYELSTAWDVSTASFVDAVDVSANQQSGIKDLWVTHNRLYLADEGGSSDGVYEYILNNDQFMVGNFSATSSLYDFTIGDTATVSPAGITEIDSNYHVDGSAAGPHAGLVELTATSTLSGTGNFGFVEVQGNASSTETTTTFTELSVATGGTYTTSASTFTEIDGDFDPSDGTYTAGSSNTVVLNGSGGYTNELVFVRNGYIGWRDTDNTGIDFSPDGRNMYITGNQNNRIDQWVLGTPWDISTRNIYASTSIASQDSTPEGVEISYNGVYMYVTGNDHDDVYQYTLSTPFDVSTASFTASSSVGGSNTDSLTLSKDGTKLFVVSNSANRIYEFTMSTPFDVTTMSQTGDFQTGNQSNSPDGIAISPDGRTMLLHAIGAVRNLWQLELSTPFDITTATEVADLWIDPSYVEGLQAVTWSADGKKVYLAGTTGDEIAEFDVTARVGTSTGSNALWHVTATSGPVTFMGDTTVDGVSTLNNGTTTFQAGSTHTIERIDWSGNSSTSELVLQSNTSGSTWSLVADGWDVDVDFVNVSDSDASGGASIRTSSSTDGGNNTGWHFAEEWNATDWTLFDEITISASNIDDDLTNFPVYVDLADMSANFWATTPTSSEYVGTDIRVTTEGGVELAREWVNASSTAQTGEIHFLADSISSTTDTTFRIYYNGTTTGDYAPDHVYGEQNVWGDYHAVWHMDEVGQSDSAGNFARSGINSDPALDSNGDIVLDLNDGMNGYTPGAGLSFTNWSSMIFWDESGTTNNGSVQEGDFNTFRVQSINSTNASNTIEVRGGNTTQHEVEFAVQDSGRQILLVTYDNSASEISIYNNGVFVATTTGTNPGGLWNVWSVQRVIGTIYETRGGLTPKTAEFAKAQWVNFSTTTDFYTITGQAPEWNDSNWTLYDTITIKASQVDDDLSDFPVYVDLADLSATFWATTDSSAEYVGTDIRVTNATGTVFELPRELVAASSTAQTGELHFKANYISSTTDTTFRIYYNGDTNNDYATNATYGAENVWTNDYAAVWHFDTDPSGSAPQLFDSTKYDNDATSTGFISSQLQTGKIDQAWDFTAGDHATVTHQTVNMLDENFTLSAWVQPDDSVSNDMSIVIKGTYPDIAYNFAIRRTTDTGDCRGYYNSGASGNNNTGTTDVGDGGWHHCVWSFSDAANTSLIYTDGADDTLSTSSGEPDTSTSDITIGGQGTGEPFEGLIDELRMSTSTRTAAWVSAEYTNQATTTDFYRVNQTVPEWNTTDWTTYVEIIIDPTNIDRTLYDFPVYVDLADMGSSFWSGVSDGGGDLRVTTGGPGPIVEIPREVVSASTTLNTGELHFKAPQLQQSIETKFRVYYNGSSDDYAIDATYGAQNVWTNGYRAVYHFDDELGGSSSDVIDSTSHANHGSSTGGMTTGTNSTSSPVGSGYSFGNGSGYRINLGDPADGDFDFGSGEEYTISSWVQSSDAANAQYWFTKRGSTGISPLYSPGGPSFLYRNDEGGANITATISSADTALMDGTWRYLVGGRNTAETFLYNNMTKYATADVTLADLSNAENLNIAADASGNGVWGGNIDEFRISTGSRSQQWLNAEYVNQGTTTDFYSTTTNASTITITEHDTGQVSNAFNFQNKTDTELFAFKATPSANTTITEVIFRLTGINDVDASDIPNLELWADVNNNGTHDSGTDSLIGSLTTSIDGQTGTVTFSSAGTALTEVTNFLVVGDTNTIARGASLVWNLYGVDVESPAVTVGTVSSIQHNRFRAGGGGGSAAVGGDAPAGDGDVGGGTNDGGELIGNDPDFMWPTAQSGSWTNPANAYDQTDGTYASAASAVTNEYTDYNDTVPGSDTIEGIEVKLEVSGTTAAGDIGVELSWDGGSSFTSTGYDTGTLTTTDAVVTLGGPSDTWGRSWSASEFSNVNFAVRVTGNPSSNTVQIDAIQVKVYHQASGGGGGGGGGGGAI